MRIPLLVLCVFVPAAAFYVGQVHVVSIGTPPQLVEEVQLL